MTRILIKLEINDHQVKRVSLREVFHSNIWLENCRFFCWFLSPWHYFSFSCLWQNFA